MKSAAFLLLAATSDALRVVPTVRTTHDAMRVVPAVRMSMPRQPTRRRFWRRWAAGTPVGIKATERRKRFRRRPRRCGARRGGAGPRVPISGTYELLWSWQRVARTARSALCRLGDAGNRRRRELHQRRQAGPAEDCALGDARGARRQANSREIRVHEREALRQAVARQAHQGQGDGNESRSTTTPRCAS